MMSSDSDLRPLAIDLRSDEGFLRGEVSARREHLSEDFPLALAVVAQPHGPRFASTLRAVAPLDRPIEEKARWDHLGFLS